MNMNLSQWKPKTQAGRLVKKGSIVSMEQLMESNLTIREPEISEFLFKENIRETTLKVLNIGSGQYRRKAVVCVYAEGYVGFGRSCAKNTNLAVAAALRNARLAMFKLQVENQTVRKIHCSDSAGTEVLILPGDMDIIASPMIKFLLNFVGIFKGKVVTNSKKDNVPLLEALIGALTSRGC